MGEPERGRCSHCQNSFKSSKGCTKCMTIAGSAIAEVDMQDITNRQGRIIQLVQVRYEDTVEKAVRHGEDNPKFWEKLIQEIKDLSLSIGHVTKNKLSLENSAADAVSKMNWEKKLELFKVLLMEIPHEHLDMFVETMTEYVILIRKNALDADQRHATKQ